MGWLATDDGLEPGDMQVILHDALEAAELLYDVTVIVETPGTYTPGGGAAEPTVAEYTVRGFEDTFSEAYQRGGLIQKGDRVVNVTQFSAIEEGLTAAIAAQEMSPSPGDRVVARGREGKLVDVGQDPARGLWVLGVAN